MSMIKTVLANLFAPDRSRNPGDRVPAPPILRGLLVHDAALCTGCGTCAHVCAPGAITVDPEGTTAISWNWFSGACSYCGLCEIWCPSRAIALEAAPPSSADHGHEVRLRDVTPLVACPRCGRAHVPLPESMQADMLRGSLEGTAAAEKDLCEDCRRRMSSTRIRDAFVGPSGDGGTGGVAQPKAREVRS